MAEISPGRLLKGKSPRLLDEWQIAPKLWDAVRFEGDQMFAVLLKMAGRKFPEICLRIQNNMEAKSDIKFVRCCLQNIVSIFKISLPAIVKKRNTLSYNRECNAQRKDPA